jgi:DNA topoisomerase-1
MAKNLVIVESPAKARTVGRYLGSDYVVMASLGHVRDLAKKNMGVDVDNDFEPTYEVSKDKEKIIKEIQKNSTGATTIYLASDPDREGEAIAWHLVHAAGLAKKNLKRVVFHEITEKAINEAFQQPRDIDENLVNAQQARRIMDRLVGFKISNVLWDKVVHYYARTRSLSGGRVQSVALKMVADREKKIEAFVPKEYWSIAVELEKASEATNRFSASLHSLYGEKKKLDISMESEAARLVTDLKGSTYKVTKVKKRDIKQRPAAPFITSSLQQESWRKLNFAAWRTMSVAQKLYEGLQIGDDGPVGLITYMRTDSTNVSSQALQETINFIRMSYGDDYVPKSPRMYASKSKGAQEAHEAIRPTDVERTPEKLKQYLSTEQFKLYDLIWKRTMASQMSDALLDSTSLDISASAPSGQRYLFTAAGSVLKFPGFRVLYMEDSDESSNDGEQATLPNLKEEDVLGCLGVNPRQHFTQPLPRFTDASLIKMLEEEGIGRPSTYAQTISTIQNRNYVSKPNGRFKVTPLGSTVSDFLTQNFPDIINATYTAQMEQELDNIASGEREWVPVLRDVYGDLSKCIEEALNVPKVTVPDELTDQVCDREELGVNCPKCGGDIVQRRGKKRAPMFYGCSNYYPLIGKKPTCDFSENQKPLKEPCPECGKLLVLAEKDGARCTACEYKGRITENELKREFKLCGKPMVIKRGRFGLFLSCTGFPACPGSKSHTAPMVTTGVSCPKCGGDIMPRQGKRRGTVFYGCSNYFPLIEGKPTCDLLLNQKPLREPCPACGELLVATERNGARCTACEYKGEISDIESESEPDLGEIAV